jgi:hypothetical protein
MCELLWTDPQDAPGRGPSKRGVGVGFGPDVTKRWCEANQVTAVIRSHEVRQNGYAIEHGESAVARNRYVEEKLVLTRTFCTDGLCITTFSCPNYCDSTGNKASSPNFLHGLHVLTLARLCLSTGRLRPDAGRRSIVIPPIRRRTSPGYPTDGVQRRVPGNGYVDVRLGRGGYQDRRCMPSYMTHRLGM